MLALFLLREESAPLVPEFGGVRPPSSTPQESSSEAAPVPALVDAESREDRSSAHTGPRGRVLEVGTGLPVEGLTVQMKFGGRVFAEATTRPDGAFDLPVPERRHRSVEVVSEKWRITPLRVRLDEEQSAGRAELLFQAERIISAPLRGKLLDRITGEPVPEFVLQVRGPRGEVKKLGAAGDPGELEAGMTWEFRAPPRRVENIVSGDDGGFESAAGFEAGWLDLFLVDHESALQSAIAAHDENAIEHEHVFDEAGMSAVAELRIAIGPTYRLDVNLPSGTSVDDFHATFYRPSSDLRGMHRVIAGDPGSAMALFYGRAMNGDALAPRAPLRGVDPIWVRFRAPVLSLHARSGSAGDHVLQVQSCDGHWSGNATVSSIEGIYPELVPITLESRGAVEGTVLDGRGKAVPQAWIQLFTSSADPSPLREVGADAQGAFAFRWLPEGPYEVVVETDRYEASRTSITIQNGTTEHLEVRLAGGAMGPVSGILRSRTGQHRSAGIVILQSLDDPDFFLLKTVTFRKRTGEYTAPFSFEDVPLGNYELRLDPLDNLRWETLSMTVSPPAEGLEFICEDDTPTFDLELRAIDARTGEPIEESWSIVWQGDPLENVRLDDDWETGLYRGVPEGVPLRWVVRAGGHRLATGDQTAILTRADHRVVEAKLERGWGQLFKVTTRDGEPIEGVELLADADLVGVTDAQGMVSMNLDTKPAGLDFRYEDWVVTWGSVDPGESGFEWGPETPVYMGPKQ